MSVIPKIRHEAPGDIRQIREIIQQAFAGRLYAEGDEAEVVDRLRDAGALSLSLVAEAEGRLVGHIAFSPAIGATPEQMWYALGPLAVLPAYQRSGIGAALLRAGLAHLGERGAAGCMLVGHPDYYRRFGFVSAPEIVPPGQPAEYFFIKPLRSDHPTRVLNFHGAFFGAM